METKPKGRPKTGLKGERASVYLGVEDARLRRLLAEKLGVTPNAVFGAGLRALAEKHGVS